MKWTERRRIRKGPMASDSSYGCNGAFILTRKLVEIHVVISDGSGWDHVSTSCRDRCPKWEEMCWIKDLFFLPEDAVIQYHPSESTYINYHPHCLHLWRPQHADLPIPPTWMVGPDSKQVLTAEEEHVP